MKIDDEFRKKLDRFGELEIQYQQAKPWIKEREALKDLIRTRYASAPAEEAQRAEGNLYYVDLTANELEREVTDPAKCFDALKKALGLDKLKAALKYTMKLIDAHVPAAEQTKFLKQERTGARDVTAVLKLAPKAA